MNWLNLIAVFIFWGYAFHWLQRGWKIRSGKQAYKSWLNPQDPLNQRVGNYTILVGIALLVGASPFVANLSIFSTAQKQVLIPFACVSIPFLIIAGSLFYESKLRIERIEPSKR